MARCRTHKIPWLTTQIILVRAPSKQTLRHGPFALPRGRFETLLGNLQGPSPGQKRMFTLFSNCPNFEFGCLRYSGPGLLPREGPGQGARQLKKCFSTRNSRRRPSGRRAARARPPNRLARRPLGGRREFRGEALFQPALRAGRRAPSPGPCRGRSPGPE